MPKQVIIKMDKDYPFGEFDDVNNEQTKIRV